MTSASRLGARHRLAFGRQDRCALVAQDEIGHAASGVPGAPEVIGRVRSAQRGWPLRANEPALQRRQSGGTGLGVASLQFLLIVPSSAGGLRRVAAPCRRGLTGGGSRPGVS